MRHGLWLMTAPLLLSGCGSFAYYGQSIHGQLGVMAASRPVDEVIADPRTSDTVRRQLQILPELRRFAVEELALPETDSYRLYADVQREALVWNVVAAPVDSLTPKKWCYPVLGCAAYRGYFDEQAAHDYAAELAGKGWDTAVEPIPAYSTLGWFSDPMPSTIVNWSLPDIAGLLFHELAHEALYVKGDSAFNESYATVVENEGVWRWLNSHGNAQQRIEYRLRERRRLEFLRLAGQTRQRLADLYAEDAERSELLARKRAIFQLFQEEYAELRHGWGGYAGYDRWMRRPLNNAHLASINTYHALEPAFRRILNGLDGDMSAFHAACAEIGSAPASERSLIMSDLLQAAENE